MIIITKPRGQVHEVHILADGETHVHTNFNVTEHDGGRLLKVSALHTDPGVKPPGIHWFREHAAVHFPRARLVNWQRLTPAGFDDRTRPIYPPGKEPPVPSLWDRAWAAISRELRSHYGFRGE